MQACFTIRKDVFADIHTLSSQ